MSQLWHSVEEVSLHLGIIQDTACACESRRDGQPTQRIVDNRRKADFITPVPKPKRRQADRVGLVDIAAPRRTRIATKGRA